MRPKKEHILWVDVAKALAIISVPISHTLPVESIIRLAIFSFHMPLFFILSGFTTTPAKDWGKFKNRTKKNFLYLIIPSLIVIFIHSVAVSLGNEAGLGSLLETLKFKYSEFFFNPFSMEFINYAAVWFMVTLFLAKLIVDFVNAAIKTEKNGIILVLLGLVGLYLGSMQYRLIFYLDIVFVACMFMEVGILWRRYEAVIKKYTPFLLVAASYFWISCIMQRKGLELRTRDYIENEVSILEAIAGSFIFSNLAMMMDEAAKQSNRLANKIVGYIAKFGSNTMLFYMVHCLDDTLFTGLWDFRDGLNQKRIYFSLFMRLVVDFAVYFIVKGVIGYYKNRKQPTPVKRAKSLKK